MGERVEPSALVVDDHKVQCRLQRCVAVLRRMVDGGWFGAHEDTVGAAWQTEAVRHLEEHGVERIAALHEMTRRYVEHAHTGGPVHDWPVP